MWGNVFAVLALLAGLGVLAGAVRHHLHKQELAREDEADARRREGETAVFARPPVFPEVENEKPLPWDGEVTEIISVTVGEPKRWTPNLPPPKGWPLNRWRAGLRRDRASLPDDATRVLEPVGLAGRCEHGEQMLNECKPCEAIGRALKLKTQAQKRLIRVDELGEWEPAAHVKVEPEILGDVLAWRKWKTIRPDHVGMGSK